MVHAKTHPTTPDWHLGLLIECMTDHVTQRQCAHGPSRLQCLTTTNSSALKMSKHRQLVHDITVMECSRLLLTATHTHNVFTRRLLGSSTTQSLM
jgi:hypothetical protein